MYEYALPLPSPPPPKKKIKKITDRNVSAHVVEPLKPGAKTLPPAQILNKTMQTDKNNCMTESLNYIFCLRK
jgi:hypothetical protein